MTDRIRLQRFGLEHTLSFDCDTPVDHVVLEAGDEPNGHFWETVAAFVAPTVVEQVELDSEGSMFSASGKRRHLKRLRDELEPLLVDEDRLRAVLAEARRQGFTIEG